MYYTRKAQLCQALFGYFLPSFPLSFYRSRARNNKKGRAVRRGPCVNCLFYGVFLASHKHSISQFPTFVKRFVGKINKFFVIHKTELCISYNLPIAFGACLWYTKGAERRASRWAADTKRKPPHRRSIRCNVTRRQYPPLCIGENQWVNF